jgi:hypothetical protein
MQPTIVMLALVLGTLLGTFRNSRHMTMLSGAEWLIVD